MSFRAVLHKTHGMYFTPKTTQTWTHKTHFRGRETVSNGLAYVLIRGPMPFPRTHRFIAVVLKLFIVRDPQIDPYQPADPHFKRYARDPHIKEDFYSSSSDSQTFEFKDPQFDMNYRLWTLI